MKKGIKSMVHADLGPGFASDAQLGERYNVSRQSIWRWASQGKFPKPVKLSPGCTRWRMTDVLAFEKGCK